MFVREIYEDKLRPDNNVSADQKKWLIQFTMLLSEASDDAFAADIDSYLDVDAFLRFFATNALLSNLDSYLGLRLCLRVRKMVSSSSHLHLVLEVPGLHRPVVRDRADWVRREYDRIQHF